jgi:hypothetical protein
MRLSRRRQLDLFEERQLHSPISNDRRQAIVEILKALLSEAASRELSTQNQKEARDEQHCC